MNVDVVGMPNLKMSQYFKSFEVEMSSSTAWVGSMSLFDPDTDVLENAFRQLGSGAVLEITLGREGNAPLATRRFRAAVTMSVPSFEHTGTTIKLDLVSTPRLRDILGRVNLGFRAGYEASAAVRWAAEQREWITTTRDGRDTIETTASTLPEDVSTNGESVFKFIREQLRPRSVNTKGKGGYSCYFDGDNVFHFHTPNFLAPKRETVIYAHDPQGDVISFSVSDNKIFQMVSGGGDATYTGVDSASGEATETQTSYADGVESGGIPLIAGADARPSNEDLFNVPYQNTLPPRTFVFARTSKTVKEIAEAQWESLRQASYSAALSRMGSHSVDMLDYLDVQIYSRSGKLHYLSGSFQIIGLSHSVDSSNWTTDYKIQRSGIQSIAGTVPAAGSSIYTPGLLDGQGGYSLPVEGE